MQRKTTLAVLLALAAGAEARADLIIAEPFDYTASEALDGKNGGTGFSGAWSTSISAGATGSATVTAGSLGFSNFPTAGNKLSVSLDTIPGGSALAVEPKRSVNASAGSGDLWASFLYRRTDTTNVNTSRIAEIRIGPSGTGTSPQMGMRAKVSGSQGVAVRYDGSPGSTAATSSIQDGSVYLLIAKFADLDQASGGAAQMWVLRASDYDGIKAGGITEAELNTAAYLKATDVQAAKKVSVGDLITISNSSSAVSFGIDVDELRYGTDLQSVVPEPAAVGGVIGAGLLLAGRQRRR